MILYGELKKGKDIISLSLGEAFFDLDYLYKSKFDHITGSHFIPLVGSTGVIKKNFSVLFKILQIKCRL